MNDLTMFNNAPSTDVAKFDDVVKVTSFLPRIQLIAPGAKLAEPVGPCKHGNYYVIAGKDDPPIDLTKEFDVIIADMRFKALSWNDSEAIEYLDMESPEFQEVQRKQAADIGKSKGNDKYDHAWGPEFLVWLPDLSQFANFFMGSKSARMSSKPIYESWAKKKEGNLTLNSHYKTGKFNYWVTQSRKCSTEPSTLPTQEDLEAAMIQFNKAPETVDEEQTTDR